MSTGPDAERLGDVAVERQGRRPPRPPRFIVRPHTFGARPGIDLDRLNQLVDELDAEAAVRKLNR